MANKILYVCQEITPYLPETEASGLCRALTQAMQERGNEIRTFMPRYGCINERRHQLHEVIRLSGMNLIIDDNDHQLIIKVASIPAARVQIYFIDNDDYFSRKAVLTDGADNYFQDNDDNLVQWLRQYSNDPQEQYLRGFLGRMLFSGDEVYKPVKVLSGGEKVRCMLSRMMLFGSNALVLDQPTNHLDLESIAALNKGLEAVKCNVLVASHDHQLIQTVCNRVFDFSTDGKLTDRRMTYDEYLESQKAE